MSLMGVLISFFPLFIFSLILGGLATSVYCSSPLIFILSILGIYVVPVVCFRIHNFLFPLKDGVYRFSEPTYSPWWGSYQIQNIFVALPGLESILISLGLFNFWLRLWGSRVGKDVFWTPTVRIADRSLLNIGSNVIFGHKVEIYGHAIKNSSRGQILMVKSVNIENNCFIGAGAHIGPGVVIEEGCELPIRMDLGINRRVKKSDLKAEL